MYLLFSIFEYTTTVVANMNKGIFMQQPVCNIEEGSIIAAAETNISVRSTVTITNVDIPFTSTHAHH